MLRDPNSNTQFFHFEGDVPLDLAISAHRGTSFVPERRAEQEIAGYVKELSSVFDSLWEKSRGPAREPFLEAFERFRQGYASKFREYLAAKGRCVSTMIAGPSGFAVGRASKANASADRATEELIEFRARGIKALRKIVFPNEAPIMSGDANAIERLRAKLADAEAFQAEAKEINAAIRGAAKNNTTPIGALRMLGIPAARCAELAKPDELGRVGIPDYALTNNSAEIRRLRKRIETVGAAKSAPTVEEFHTDTGIAFVDAPEANRVRLKFPGKPDAGKRAELKAHGFRWAPSVDGGVWQAYRNDRALAHARQVAEGAGGRD